MTFFKNITTTKELLNIKIIIIDFEFTNYQRNSIVLILGAITQSHINSYFVRMRRRSLIIPPKGDISIMTYPVFIKTEILLKRIFKNKPETLQKILTELHF